MWQSPKNFILTFIERSPLLSGRGHLFHGPKLNFSLFWNCIKRSVERNYSKHDTTSGMDLRLNSARTSTFRESFFIRICPMWNALPLEIRISERTPVFKTRLKKLLFARLQSIFDPENIRTWHITCPICRSSNVDAACSCWLNILKLNIYVM